MHFTLCISIVFTANVNSVFRYLSSPHHFLLSVGFHCRFGQNVENKSQNIYIYIYIYIFMSSCVGGSKAPPGTISAIYTRYAGTISTSYKNFR